MTWAVVRTRPAVADPRRLDRQTTERIRRAVRRLADESTDDAARLQGVSPPEWRLRVGDWRVRFAHDFKSRTPQLLRVRHRARSVPRMRGMRGGFAVGAGGSTGTLAEDEVEYAAHDDAGGAGGDDPEAQLGAGAGRELREPDEQRGERHQPHDDERGVP